MALISLTFFLFFCLGTATAGGLSDFSKFLQGATDIAGILGTSSSGKINRGRGCTINWSYEGMVMGLEWKYMGVCMDSCTGETMTVFKLSRGGAVEHCLTDLMQKLQSRQEL